ncbi:MAG: hypothetical protein RL015_3557 [Verrucomicrobiota bacterium]|jgi:hypothetical protein
MKRRAIIHKNAFSHVALCLSLMLSMVHISAKAQTSSCQGIADDVTTAVSKEPGKVLMIVEDALVINESCACEIIKAAILASQADASLVNQIVQTAISVSPKQSGIIMDCATSISPNSLSATDMTAGTTSGKDVKNPLPVEPAPSEPEEDFKPIPSNIRGIYLMQPPAGGFIPDLNGRKRDDDCVSPTNTHPKPPYNTHPKPPYP